MKASVKAQWVRDLRSGEYTQGRGVLEEVNQDGKHFYCCLGVLCRQAVRAGAIPEPVLCGHTFTYADSIPGFPDNATGLPQAVGAWAGLPMDEHGEYNVDVYIRPGGGEGGGWLSAIGANDAECMTFAEIADLIEQNVPAE